MRSFSFFTTRLFLLTYFASTAMLSLEIEWRDNGATDDYEFVENLTRPVWLIQGDTKTLGKLDQAGNFIPDLRFFRIPKNRGLSGPGGQWMNDTSKEPVYEFRSGRLIKGNIDDDGTFVPEIGTKITDFKDYHYSKDAPRIYNLPGHFVKKGSKAK